MIEGGAAGRASGLTGGEALLSSAPRAQAPSLTGGVRYVLSLGYLRKIPEDGMAPRQQAQRLRKEALPSITLLPLKSTNLCLEEIKFTF